MGLNNTETIVEGDFIQQADKDATPSNDENKAPKMEADGRLSQFFTRLGAVLNCGETINGSTTPVPVYQNKTDNELYACDANDTNKLKFIGFVVSNGTDGNPATFQGAGVVSGFTGLSEGEKYYLQDTVATIGTTAGTYEVLVGIAISETQLLIQKGRRHASGVGGSVGTASSNTPVTCGFRPSLVRIYGFDVNTGGTDMASFILIWRPGGAAYLTVAQDSGGSEAIGSGTTSGIVMNQPGSTSNGMGFSITSVTDTGFTITITEQATYTGQGHYIWEAEGEL